MIKSIIVLGHNLRSTAVYQKLTEMSYDCCQIDPDLNIIAHTDTADLSGYKAIENYDLAILAGWSKKIDKATLKKPKFGFLTCHAGLVPEYRGSSPLNWSILNGEKTFGLSVIQTNEEFDEGDIYAQARYDISQDHNIKDLHDITNDQFPILVQETIFKIDNGIKPTPQLKTNIGYFPRRNKDDSKVDFHKYDAIQVKNLFRALVPLYPAPFFNYEGREIEITSLPEIIAEFNGTPGKVYKKDGKKYLIACRKGAIWTTFSEARNIKIYSILNEFS